MSRHEGVSCDACMKGNFTGKRYKCLICYDYDLCPGCFEAGATTTRHTTDHPVQCILTRTDFDLYYGGEALTVDQPQAFTCPFCANMGFSETSLQEHVTVEHPDSSAEVVCPICAALPGGDPNHVTDDFAAHLTLEHRTPRDFEEPIGGIRHVRRIPHPGRGVGGARTRRSNMHFQGPGATLSGLSPGSRETMDPIAELLSQLSSVRNRAAAAQSVSSQLQQLEMQLQSTSDNNDSATDLRQMRLPPIVLAYSKDVSLQQQLERLPRRQTDASRLPANNMPVSAGVMDFAGAVAGSSITPASHQSASNTSNPNSQYLLSRIGEAESSEMERQAAEVERANRSVFVQELLLSSLAEGLRLSEDEPGSSDEELDEVNRSVASGSDLTDMLLSSPRNEHSGNSHRNMVKHKDGIKAESAPPPPSCKH